MKFKLISFTLILILIVGCGNNDENELPDIPDYHSGTEGLSMKFLTNLPPNEIWENSDFIIGLELQNKGPSPIDDGIIVVTGFDPDYIMLNQDESAFELEERGPSYPEGGYKIINIPVRSIAMPEGSDSYSAGFTIRAYYDYQTEATATVCIDPNVYSLVSLNKACEVKEITMSGGQGAPVAITKVEPRISPSDSSDIESEFKITIQNSGSGEVLGYININEVLLGTERIECNFKKVELKDKKASFICKTNIDASRGSYSSPLTARFSYKYTQKLDKNINIIALTQE